MEGRARSAQEMEVRNSLLNDYLSEGSRGLAEWNLFTWCVQSLILRKLQFSREVKEEMAEKIIRLAVVSPTFQLSLFIDGRMRGREKLRANTKSWNIMATRTNRKILSEKKGKFYVCERIAKKFLFIICDF